MTPITPATPTTARPHFVSRPTCRERRGGSFAVAFAMAAATLVFTVGCTNGQRDASNYDDTEEAFLDGCVSIATSDNEAIGGGSSEDAAETRISSPTDYCGCIFDEIRKTIPFSDFKQINSKLRDEGGALPDGFRDAYESCDPSSDG